MSDELWEDFEGESRRRDRLQTLGMVFRPAGPIDHRDLFRGRMEQLARVNSLIYDVAQHGVIFGERGVGKTSLAAVSAQIVQEEHIALRVNCDASDNFASLWDKVIDDLSTMAILNPDTDLAQLIERAVEVLSFDEIGPGRVRKALTVLSAYKPVLIFLDEFDRLQSPDTRVMVADTIKTLSDQLVKATIVLVGVADDVESLLSHHASVSRSLAQVRMPRMELAEIKAIVSAGFAALGLEASADVMHLLTYLPQGLPAYAHGLAQMAAERAIGNDATVVVLDDVRYAVASLVQNADEPMTRLYTDAVATAHKNTLYERVVLACALAPTDEAGYFNPIGLRAPLYRIMGEDVEQARYARHLQQFCEERGPLLDRRGFERHWRYRFVNPMMRPYLVMRAYNNGMSLDVLDLAIPVDETVVPQQQLFDT
jgi:Cdc6-like AAA superfamily ATPase